MTTATDTLEPDWLVERRVRARAVAEGLTLPDHRTKGWEFTDLGGLELGAFPGVSGGDAGAREGAVELFEGVEGARRLDQVDALTLGGQQDPDGAAEPLVLPLAVAAERFPDLAREHLGAVVAGDGDVFVQRNEAEWTGGAFVYVPRGARIEQPVLITALQQASDTALNWRTLIVLEEGAQAEVWEQYLSADEDVAALFNGVVEISVGAGANLRYVCGQGLSERSWVFATQRAEVGRDGSLDWIALGFGSARGKVRMETKLAGPGAEAKVTGLYASHGRQHLDFDTTQEHAAPSTTSDLAFRGLLDGRSSAVWRGIIRVDPGAQKTDAFQESRNLLLSKRAHADAIPGLEIEANDVRCTHAAAIAQIDPEQLFYLRSRGLPQTLATRLVIEGFLRALLDRFAEGPVREALAQAVERRLELVLGKLG